MIQPGQSQPQPDAFEPYHIAGADQSQVVFHGPGVLGTVAVNLPQQGAVLQIWDNWFGTTSGPQLRAVISLAVPGTLLYGMRIRDGLTVVTLGLGNADVTLLYRSVEEDAPWLLGPAEGGDDAVLVDREVLRELVARAARVA